MPQNLLEHVSASYLLLRLVGLPVILAVDGGFPVRGSPGRSLSFDFPRSYGLATNWIGDMATGICNDVLGDRPLVELGVKRREEFGRRISSSVPTSSKFRRRFRRVVKDSLSLSAVAHYMCQGRPQWKQTGLLSAVLHTSVFLGSGGNF
ncbi:hypothetical protein TNCV_2699711 [Trichonephila clavipes]|nr:hypothetical protein TNCV_2699711 [Trichonephila clavipes]